VLLGVGGVGSFASSGCALQKDSRKIEKGNIQKEFEIPQAGIEDPNGYMKYLKQAEFVVGKEIFESYADTVDKRPK
jgi:hypothetical protein